MGVFVGIARRGDDCSLQGLQGEGMIAGMAGGRRLQGLQTKLDLLSQRVLLELVRGVIGQEISVPFT